MTMATKPPKKKKTFSDERAQKRFYNTQHKTKMKMSDGQVLELTASQYGSIRSKNRGIHENPKEATSTELPEPESPEGDDYDTHSYPPPSKSPLFRKIWMQGIDGIVARSNFSPAHLGLYEIYCSLLTELRQLEEFIRQHGMTYRMTTMTGEMRKTYPEVSLRDKARSQLAHYARLLDLKPSADKSISADKQISEEWS